MKKTSFKIIIISILLIILYIFFCLDFDMKEVRLERPKTVPKSAVWAGGIDGGYWFDLVEFEMKPKEFKFIIYNESTGDIYLQDSFVITDNCKKIPLNILVLDEINYYANSQIVLKNGCILNQKK
jgi:hypothetical protein